MTILCTANSRSQDQMSVGVNGKLLAVIYLHLVVQVWQPSVYVYNASAPTRTTFTEIVQSGV
jgi:hypothetical protein